MKRLMFLGVFLLFCCGVVSSANAAVCCTISDNFGNKTEHTANSCTALGGLSNDFPPECSKGVCDVADGGDITCAAGLTKCCVYDAGCGNTNNLKCSCVVDCKPCDGVQSEKQYKGTNGCTNYQSVQCNPSYSETQTLNRYNWIQAVVKTETTACSEGCYLEGGECKLDCSGYGKILDETRNMCICDTGYYNEDGNCQKCPNFDVATSLAGKAKSVEHCYLPVNKKYEDKKGWFEATSKCDYDVSRN